MGIKHVLRDVLSQEELALLVSGYDVVGDIAIIIIPPELQYRESIIGEAVLTSNSRLKVVARRAGQYGGEFRTLPLRIIAGENRKETLHKEHGIQFFLHLEKVYFSVRSGGERKRIASLVKEKEKVLVLFSGIGAFPLILAHLSDAACVVGIEKNPEAHFYALKNIAINKKIKNVHLHEGDVMNILPRMSEKFDRILMPLPSHAEIYLDVALKRLKERGTLHFYEFQEKGRYDRTIEKVKAACQRNRLQLLGVEVAVCGHIAPGRYRVCADALVD